MALIKKPVAQHVASGWVVEGEVGGGTDFGVVHWQSKGHSAVTAAGLAALAGQVNTYYGGLATIPASATVRVNVRGGAYAVASGDLDGQLAAINTILASAANITGSAA